eukprot:639252-Prorocentrum_minimum.AAC.3
MCTTPHLLQQHGQSVHLVHILLCFRLRRFQQPLRALQVLVAPVESEVLGLDLPVLLLSCPGQFGNRVP